MTAYTGHKWVDQSLTNADFILGSQVGANLVVAGTIATSLPGGILYGPAISSAGVSILGERLGSFAAPAVAGLNLFTGSVVSHVPEKPPKKEGRIAQTKRDLEAAKRFYGYYRKGQNVKKRFYRGR